MMATELTLIGSVSVSGNFHFFELVVHWNCFLRGQTDSEKAMGGGKWPPQITNSSGDPFTKTVVTW